MGNVIRINEGSATSAVKTLAGKVSVTESARQKVSSATSKIKWDDIFSIGHYSRSIYNGLDEAKKELKNLSSMMESVTNTSQSAIKSFSSVDGSGKAKSSKTKKRDWGKIFKNLGIYSGIVTAGTLVAGSAGYFIAQDVAARVIGGKNTKNSSDSVTVVNSSKKNSINQKKIDEKGKNVNNSYNAVKAEHDEWEAKQAPNLSSKVTMNASGSMDQGSNPLDQHSYSQFDTPDGNQGCACTAYAIGASIIEGKTQDPTSFAAADGVSLRWDCDHYPAGYDLSSTGYNYQPLYDHLKSGNPILTSFNANTASQHYVVITGVRPGANVNSLSASDFIVIDPCDGATKNLTESWGYSESTMHVNLMS